ncbi:6343_t:CDS:1, partial [Racocetra persica]
GDEDETMGSENLNEDDEICEHDPQMQTLRELAQKSRGKAKMAPPKTTAQNIENLNGQQQANGEMSENGKKSRKRNYQDSGKNESPETLECKILAEFKVGKCGPRLQ